MALALIEFDQAANQLHSSEQLVEVVKDVAKDFILRNKDGTPMLQMTPHEGRLYLCFFTEASGPPDDERDRLLCEGLKTKLSPQLQIAALDEAKRTERYRPVHIPNTAICVSAPSN
jgi:hypothetical protein